MDFLIAIHDVTSFLIVMLEDKICCCMCALERDNTVQRKKKKEQTHPVCTKTTYSTERDHKHYQYNNRYFPYKITRQTSVSESIFFCILALNNLDVLGRIDKLISQFCSHGGIVQS